MKNASFALTIYPFNEPGNVSFSLSASKNQKTSPGNIKLNNAKVSAEYDKSLSYSTDVIKLESKLKNEWQTETLTRIRLTDENVVSKEYVLTAKTI